MCVRMREHCSQLIQECTAACTPDNGKRGKRERSRGDKPFIQGHLRCVFFYTEVLAACGAVVM